MDREYAEAGHLPDLRKPSRRRQAPAIMPFLERP
jgi:hypothetical protein